MNPLALLTRDYRLEPTATAFALGAPLWALATLTFPAFAYAAFGISLVWLGLPHGAVDDRVALRLAGLAPVPALRLAVAVAYLASAAAVYGWWFCAPVPAFLGFLLLTVAHWGQGDAHFVSQACPGYFGGRLHRLFFTIWRGAAPMCLPLAFYPAEYSRVAQGAVSLFRPHDGFGPPSSGARAVALALALAALAVEKGFAGHRRRRYPSVSVEDAVLLIAFLALPPLVSVGVYFLLWHSPRHLVRLGAVSGPTPWAFRWPQYVPWTLASLAALGLFRWWAGVRTGDLSTGLGAYLVLLSGLTFPHFLVVVWMDAREGTRVRS